MKKTIFTFIALGLAVFGTECTAQDVSGKVKGHAYVDLGLKSGLKWATCNIGSKKVTDSGDYFAWGETKAKKEYSWDNYKWCGNKKADEHNNPQDFSKYCTDSKHGKADNVDIVEAKDDAASTLWGGTWRTPTNDELGELLDICNWKWEANFHSSGVSGYLGTSKKNGNKIFIPACGYNFDGNKNPKGENGGYWSSTLYNRFSPCAYYIDFAKAGIEWDIYTFRGRGMCIRAVTK